MKLNLGCQIHYFEGWINQDVVGDDPNMRVDLVCDAAKLPLEDNSVDFIYAGHLVEHFYPDTLPAAINEWHRVLKRGGMLVIVTPDSGAVMKDYAMGKFDIDSTWQQIYGRIFHYDRESERHHIAFDRKKLIEYMTQRTNVFWEEWKDFDFNNPPKELVPFMDKHISRGAYQLGMIFQKIV